MNKKASLKKELALVMKREVKEEEDEAPPTKFVKQEEVKQEEVKQEHGRRRDYKVFKADLSNLRGRRVHELRSRG